jgi:hypothetical protein
VRSLVDDLTQSKKDFSSNGNTAKAVKAVVSKLGSSEIFKGQFLNNEFAPCGEVCP